MPKPTGYPYQHKGLCTPLNRCPYCRSTEYLEKTLDPSQRDAFYAILAEGGSAKRQTRSKRESKTPAKAAATPKGASLKELGLSASARIALRKLGITSLKALASKTRESLMEAGVDGRILRGVEAALAKAGTSLKK